MKEEFVECSVCHEPVKLVMFYSRILETHGPDNNPCKGSGLAIGKNEEKLQEQTDMGVMIDYVERSD